MYFSHPLQSSRGKNSDCPIVAQICVMAICLLAASKGRGSFADTRGGERSFAASANHPSRGVGSRHSGHPKLGLALRCRKFTSSPSSRIEPAGRMPTLANTQCRAVQFTSGKFSQSCKGKQYQKTQYHSNLRNFLHFLKALQARHHETGLRLCYKSLIKTTQK